MAPALNRPAAVAAAACPEHVCARHGQYFTRRREQERRLGAFGWMMMMVELGETRANNNNGGGWCGVVRIVTLTHRVDRNNNRFKI